MKMFCNNKYRKGLFFDNEEAGRQGGGGGASDIFDAAVIESDPREGNGRPVTQTEQLREAAGNVNTDELRRQAQAERQGQQQQGQEQLTQQAQGQQAIALNPNDIADLVSRTVGTTLDVRDRQQQERQQQNRVLTREEQAARVNRYTPTPEVLNNLRSDDPAVQAAAYELIRQGMTQESVTTAYLVMQELMKPIQQQLGEATGFATEQRNRQQRENFFSTYKELKSHEDIVQMVAEKLIQSNPNITRMPNGEQILAGEVEKVIKRVNPDFKLGTQTTIQTNGNGTTSNMPAMAALNGGTGGGGGRGTSSSQDKKAKLNGGLWT